MKMWAVFDHRGKMQIESIAKTRWLAWNEMCWQFDPRQIHRADCRKRLKEKGYRCKRIKVEVMG